MNLDTPKKVLSTANGVVALGAFGFGVYGICKLTSETLKELDLDIDRMATSDSSLAHGLAAVKNHVKKHRGKYAAAGTTVAFLALIRRNNEILSEFLKEHDLYDEYWNSDEEL